MLKSREPRVASLRHRKIDLTTKEAEKEWTCREHTPSPSLQIKLLDYQINLFYREKNLYYQLYYRQDQP
jgi:hypothetical protein